MCALAADAIRELYFGKKTSSSNNSSSTTQSNKVETQVTPQTQLIQRPEELTASARFIIREARKRLGQRSAMGEHHIPEEQELFELVRRIESTEREELSERERNNVVAALTEYFEDFDILTPLIENEEVNDIIVSSYKDISVQTGRANIQTDLHFSDQDAYRSFVENLLKRVGKACTTATPVVDAALSPHIRVCVAHESFCPIGMGPLLTIRISRHRNLTLDTLLQNELAPKILLDYLGALSHSGETTLLIAGEVGTGKTTLIKALASRVAEEEAILIIEDTQEVLLNRRFVRTLLTREANTEGVGRIAPAQAIRTGMRMAMNRIILGEIRDAEAAEAFVDVCSSGHAGMSTIHARSARDALSRLELFLARAQGNVTVETIRRQIANAISVVIFLGVEKETRKRRIVEVVEVGTSGDGMVQISPIFKYFPRGMEPEWKRDVGVTNYRDILNNHKVNLPHAGEYLSLDTYE
jgi:pilus assembly protein CpaF